MQGVCLSCCHCQVFWQVLVNFAALCGGSLETLVLQPSPEEGGRRWPDLCICCSWLLAATSSHYPAGLRAGGREARTLKWWSFPWCPLCPLFFLDSFFLGWCALGEGALSLPAGSFKHLFRGGKDSSSAGDQGGSWALISAVGRHIVPLGGTGGSCWALLPPATFLPSAMCKHKLECGILLKNRNESCHLGQLWCDDGQSSVGHHCAGSRALNTSLLPPVLTGGIPKSGKRTCFMFCMQGDVFFFMLLQTAW